MERNSEAKRGSMAAVNGIGLSRRRHRITALRDSPEEEGQMDLQETVRSRERERVQKADRVRDRDQELMSQRKRRRTVKSSERGKHRDVESGGAQESSGPSGEETYDEDYEEPSSSMSNRALRRTVSPTRIFRSIWGLRVADEMIGAEVARRARSASVKRLNAQWTSSPWGSGEWQGRRTSSLGGSVDIILPSSSSVSLRKKMKPKGLISKVSRKPLPSVQDDIEIEVVEALFDLMKQSQSQLQSQSSKKEERISDNISEGKLDLIGNKDVHTKSDCSPTVSAQIGPETSDLPPDINSTSIASLEAELSTESELKFGKMSSDALERTGEISLGKGKESSGPAEESIGGDQVVVAKDEDCRSCAKPVGDGSADSTVSKGNLASDVVKPKTEAKFEIDLMALPPMPSSPDKDGLKVMAPDPKLDLEKPKQENVSSCSYNNLQGRERNHCIVSDSERENYVLATGWPGGVSQPGCDFFPLDESSRTTALQLTPFAFSQPRSKRCLTHQYVACNIRHHQQLNRKYMLPTAAGPATFHETKPCSRSPAASTPNSFFGNPLLGDLSGRHSLATPLDISVKGKSFEVTNPVDATMDELLLPQQISELAPAGNLLQPALMFPPGQHEAANLTAQQPGSNKSATAVGKATLSNDPAGGGLAFGTLSFPAGKDAVSFSYSSLPTNDAPPFMAIMHSNTHPYSVSTNSGMPLPNKGDQAPVLPFLNASYYPSMFCMPQNQQKQLAFLPQMNPLYQLQQASPTMGISSSSTSCHEQSKNHLQIMAQSSSKSSFGLEALQLQQPQKQHVLGSHSSSKSDDIPGSHAQNHGIPSQTMNFALVSHGDGKQRHQPGSEQGVEVISRKAVGFSFDSTASTKLAVHISALPQDTAAFQMRSNIGQLACQFISSAQVAQDKNFQVAGKKSVVSSDGTVDGEKALLAKSLDQSLMLSKLESKSPSASTVKEVTIDGSIQTRSSLPQSNTGNHSSSSSTAPNAAFSVNAPISQQQRQQKEINQLQRQHTQQMQLTGTVQVQAPMSDNFRYSFIGCNYPNINPIFSLVHNNNLVQSSQLKNASVATTSQIPSLATISSLKNFPLQQLRNSQVPPHIAFGSSLNSATLGQGQQFLINRQPTSSVVNGHSSNSSASMCIYGSGSLKTTSGDRRGYAAAVAELPPQQTELLNGPSQKSVPVCGRDVPSIISTCPSKLSELDY